LNLLGKISIKDGINAKEFNSRNRKLDNEDDVSFILNFIFDESEQEIYGDIAETTQVNFINKDSIEVNGGFSELINRNKELLDATNEILKNANENVFKLDRNTSESYKAFFDMLKNIDTKINIKYKQLYLKIKVWSKKITDTDVKESVLKNNDTIYKELEKAYSLFPIFYLYEDYKLNDTYTCNEKFFENGFKDFPAFELFCQAADIKIEELKTACLSEDVGRSEESRDSINKKLKMNIQDKFNNFYKQEEVEIKIRFNGTKVTILIDTSNNLMKFSERSSGLRWYLMLFVSLNANNILNDKLVMLIDEPGVHLHVQAQKRLLMLFDSLTKNNKQLIYTTHSPYMLNSESLIKSRAIEKKNGTSYFINKIYNGSIKSESRFETLSPLLEVIGLDMKFNFGPNENKLNIITEGITDYMYVVAMIKRFDIDNVYVLPSTGVTNINSIVSILIGWGYEFKVILDYDREGRKEGEKLKRKLNIEEKNDYVYLNCVFDYSEKDVEIETLVSNVDYEKLGYNTKGQKKYKKTLAAKDFYDMVTTKKIDLSGETDNNFRKLFEKLNIYNC